MYREKISLLSLFRLIHSLKIDVEIRASTCCPNLMKIMYDNNTLWFDLDYQIVLGNRSGYWKKAIDNFNNININIKKEDINSVPQQQSAV